MSRTILKILFLTGGISVLWSCQNQKSVLNPPALVQSHAEKPQLTEEKKLLILRSTLVEYFEIPGFQEISDPRELGTFSIPVRNEGSLSQFRRLVTQQTNSYSLAPPEKCKPHYISALVFHSEGKKETILYSLDCRSLYLYEEKLYLNLNSDGIELEKIFREIRSGR